LLVRGLVREKDPYTVALVLREAPPRVPGIVARRVVTFEEYAAASQVQWEAFGGSEAELAERRALLEQADQCRNCADEGRLPRAVRAKQGGDLAGPGDEIETIQAATSSKRLLSPRASTTAVTG
jgi:hypothetical protein